MYFSPGWHFSFLASALSLALTLAPALAPALTLSFPLSHSLTYSFTRTFLHYTSYNLFPGMTTFSSTNHEALENEEYNVSSERLELTAPPPPPPPRVAMNQVPEDAYAAAAASSGFENAYVNALCAELSNIIQFNDNNVKRDQVEIVFFDATTHLYKRSCPSDRPSVRRSIRRSRVIFKRRKSRFLSLEKLRMTNNNNNNDDNNHK